jgi:hypothetical protein
MRVSLGGMLLAVSAALALGCGGGAPTQPNPSPNPNPAPQPSTWTITGTVTTTLTGEPVPGAALNFTTQTVTTDGAGRWTLTGPGTASGTFGVEVSAPAYITRKTAIRAENGRDVTIDLIRDGGPFSLGFYRQFVRNDFDTPGNLQVLRRWTEAPSVYVDIRNPRTGQLTAEEIESIRLAASEAIPVYSGGVFTLQRFEYGAESRPQVAGWINVEISYEPDGNYCGRAFVGSNPGLITMNYDRCFCGSAKLDPQTLRHEFGHAMGFWHVSHASAILNPNPATRPDCRSSAFSDMERHHARIAYSRPPGNADVDWDQLSPSLLQAFLHEPAPVVTCFTR